MSDFMQVLQSVAKPGSIVKKGQVIAEFDRQFQEQRLDDFKAQIEQSERTMRSIDAQIDVQRKAFTQNISLAKGAVEQSRLDLKTTPVRSTIDAEVLKLSLEESQARLKQYETQVPYQETSMKSQRRTSELDLDQAKIELKRAERNVELMGVKATMDGMLVMENIMRGSEFAQIQQGDQLFPGQMFARIVDPSSMLVSATANQADIEMLRVGAKAILRFDAYPGLELPAHVISIAAITKPGGMRSTFVKEVPVFLKIDKMDPRVIPDLSVSADIIVESAENLTLAPMESVFRDSPSAKPYVFVKTAAGFEKREVDLGLANHIQTSVRSGLKPGEVVALERPQSPQGQNATTKEASMGRVPEALPARNPFLGVFHV